MLRLPWNPCKGLRSSFGARLDVDTHFIFMGEAGMWTGFSRSHPDSLCYTAINRSLAMLVLARKLSGFSEDEWFDLKILTGLKNV